MDAPTGPTPNPEPVEWIDLLGVRVSNVDREQTHRLLRQWVREDVARLVVTADASAVVIAARDPDYLQIVNRAALVTPDGAGILWAAHRAGTPLRERVSGVDLAEHLIARSAEQEYGVFLYGAAPGVAAAAAGEMSRRYPGCRIVGTAHGYLGRAEEQTRLLEEIRAAAPRVLLVALGIPAQEKWLAAHLPALGVPVGMGVGGTFDVLSGRTRRAPVWMQRRGLEWLYRLALNPRKLAKVSTLPSFVVRVLTRRRVG